MPEWCVELYKLESHQSMSSSSSDGAVMSSSILSTSDKIKGLQVKIGVISVAAGWTGDMSFAVAGVGVEMCRLWSGCDRNSQIG